MGGKGWGERCGRERKRWRKRMRWGGAASRESLVGGGGVWP